VKRLLPPIAAALALAVAGCAGSSGPPEGPSKPAAQHGQSLPPRPVELRLDGVDPCTLLTDAQRARLEAGPGTPDTDQNGPLPGKVCTWLGATLHPDQGYDVTLALTQGAEFALGGEPLRSVDGFAATTTTSIGSDPNYFCGLLVDVAPGQSLAADYSNNGHDYPGMNRELACYKAQQLAEAMLSTLRAQRHR